MVGKIDLTEHEDWYYSFKTSTEDDDKLSDFVIFENDFVWIVWSDLI